VRVTQSMLTQQFLYNLSNDNTNLQQEQVQMSSGKMLNEPSDNPLAVSQDMAIRDTLNQTTAYQSVISSGMSWMQDTSSAVQSMMTTLQSVQQNVLQALNASNDNPVALNALAVTTQQMVSQVYGVVNTQQDNRYLFGGTQTNTPPQAFASSSLAGPDAYDAASVGQGSGGISQPAPMQPIASGVKDLAGLLQPGQSYQVVFNASSISSTGTISSGSLSLQTVPTLSGAAPQTLATVSLAGAQLGNTVTLQTTPGGAPGMQITLNHGMFQVSSGTSSGSYSQTDTIYPSSGSSSDLNYEVSQGVQVPVNLTAAGMFHTVPSGGTQDLQSTLSSIVADIQSMASDASAGNAQQSQSIQSHLQEDLNNLQQNTSQMTNMNADLGARMQRMTALSGQISHYSQTLTNQKGKLENADMASVITRFSTDQTVLQAALQMGAKVLLPSLINFLPNG